TSLPTLAAALITPAPMSVPATPNNDASTAAVTEASALATTWTGLRWIERSRSFMVTVEGVAPGSELYTAHAKYIYRSASAPSVSDRSSVTLSHGPAAPPPPRPGPHRRSTPSATRPARVSLRVSLPDP